MSVKVNKGKTIWLPEYGDVPTLEAAKGGIAGVSFGQVYGENPSIGSTSVADVWDGGSLHVPPTFTNGAQVHLFVSDSIQDAGSALVSSSMTTDGGEFDIHDSEATFITDSVSAGNAFLNDTRNDHSIVKEVISETHLALVGLHDGQLNTTGDAYRIVKATGTGTAVVHVKKGLDVNFDYKGEFVVMNGTTTATSVHSYTHLDRIHNDLCGTSETNVGAITAKAVTDGTITASIRPGKGQSLSAILTVPRRKDVYLMNWWGNMGKIGGGADPKGDISLRYRKFNPVATVGTIVEHNYHIDAQRQNQFHHTFGTPKVVRELVTVFIRVDEVDKNNVTMRGGFDFIMVDSQR